MKFRQVLPLSLTALLMSVLLTISAFAATEPSAVGFLDIPSDSACYEAVTYLADRGITMSIGNQCFSPEELITVRQWAAMLNRAYQADAAEVYGDGCVLRCYREGWLTETAMEAPDFRMCRSALLESAFHAAGLPVYDYALYPDGEELSEYENVLRVGTELGLCSQESSPLDLMARSDAAEVLFQLLTCEYEVGAPPMSLLRRRQAPDAGDLQNGYSGTHQARPGRYPSGIPQHPDHPELLQQAGERGPGNPQKGQKGQDHRHQSSHVRQEYQEHPRRPPQGLAASGFDWLPALQSNGGLYPSPAGKERAGAPG